MLNIELDLLMDLDLDLDQDQNLDQDLDLDQGPTWSLTILPNTPLNTQILGFSN